jgi:WNK lysine deficient protein kinase
MSAGLALDHPAVIRSYQCWEDPAAGCVNLVTEFFTSGNLRDYRRRHAALEGKAVKKWARQVLGGLAYLHGRDPPVVHGDLRADKVYINGHTGEIKIGDLGLEALVPRRFAPGVVPDDPADQYTRAVDVFAFGLMILELVTARPMDRGHSREWAAALAGVADAGARAFIGKCLAPEPERPAAAELLRDAFLAPPAKVSPPADGSAHGGSMLGGGGGSLGAPGGSADDAGGGGALGAGPAGVSGRSYAAAAASAGPDAPAAARRAAERAAEERERAARAECEAGSVRGEDYLFQFSGRVRDGKLHFRLHMAYEGDEDGAGGSGGAGGGNADDANARSSKTIDFVYDPDTDTADEIAAEISSEFDLSPTDRDICAAALKEWLADRGPDAGGGGRD